ncbi:unnamed protein product, partial [Bubo scandiacus]
MAGHGEAAAAEEEEAEEEEEGVRITPQLLKASTGEFALESILLLRLRGRGIAHLGCLGDCANLEWLDLSGNAIVQLGPLAALRSLAVLNLARNRVASLEPLGSCHNLQSLNVAGNLVSSLHQLRCLTGLRRLESLRLRDPLARLANPLCAAPAYRAALADMFPALKAIDGERVSGRGSELYQLCRDLDSSLGRGDGDDAGPQPLPARGSALGGGRFLGAAAAPAQLHHGGGLQAVWRGAAGVPGAEPPRRRHHRPGGASAQQLPRPQLLRLL